MVVGLPPGPGRCRRRRRPAVRQLGRRARARPTTGSSSSPTSGGSSTALRGVPTIHFGTGTAALLELLAEAGGDVIGLDHRVSLADAWRRVGHDRGVQGNLDSARLLAGWEATQAGRSGGPRRGGRPARPRLQPRPRRAARDRHRPAAAARRPRPRADRPDRGRRRGGRVSRSDRARRAAHDLRLAGLAGARGHPRLPRARPRRPRAGSRARRRVHPALPGHRRLAADRDHPRAGRRPRGCARLAGRGRHALLRTVDPGGAAGARRRRRRRRSPRSSSRRSTRRS